MTLKNNSAYNSIKKKYYRYFAYRKLHPIWDIKNLVAKIRFDNLDLIFTLEREYNNGRYFKPVYLSSNLGFFNSEIKGYFYRGNIPKEGVILDVGAYHGGFSIYLAKLKRKFKILAFEPDPNNISVMKENLKLNQVKDIKIIPKGIWNKKEKLSFDQTGATGSISSSGNLKIQVTDLDSELKRLKIPFDKVSFVKMDIEGAEIEAIEGMKELLKKGSPHLAIATYHIREGKKTYSVVEKKLRELGYNVETGCPKHLTTWAWKD